MDRAPPAGGGHRGVPGPRGPGPPARRGRPAPAPPGPGGVRARPRRPRQRPPPPRRAEPGPGAARAGGLRLAHRAPGLPPGRDHGSALGRPPGRDGPAQVSGPEPETFLSGESGEVSGIRRTVTRTAADLRLDAGARLRGHARKLDRLAAAEPPRKALVLSAYRAGSLLPAALERLRSERHEVRFALGAVGDPDPALADWTLAQGLEGGKFQNLNQVLEVAA